MAKRPFRAKRKPATLDELGGGVDGGIAILDSEGNRIHMSPTRVTAALRYFLARVRLHETVGLPRRLALTSALAGEGVTYIARSLGAAIAYDSEASVAIVDFNWLRPRQSEGTDEPRRQGLADVIEGELELDDVILRTANPRLSLIPPGELPVARRPAVARSERLDKVLDELDGRYDHLLLDLPPVLATSEAMDLTQFADACVLVVRQGATSESQVEAALEELEGVETLGVILNRFDSAIPRRLRRLVGT